MDTSALVCYFEVNAARATVATVCIFVNELGLQEMLPDFDPFGISTTTDAPAQHNNLSEIEEDVEESSTPLSGAARAASKLKYGGRHRRTTSEPTPMDSWQLRSEWPQH